MQKFGVLGGGISGLSTAYYLLQYQPSASVTLFEKDRLGGVIQTSRRGSSIYETGPRSLRVSTQFLEIIEMADHIGIPRNDMMLSSTTSYDAKIFTDGKIRELFPGNRLRALRGALRHPFILRTFLANFLKKKKLPSVDDESL